MNPLIQEMASVVRQELDNAKKILLMCHPRADFDSVSSVLALGGMLESWGKEVVMIAGDTPLPKFAVSYPGVEKIKPLNLFQVDLTQFDLFVVLDMSVKSRLSELGEVVFPSNLRTLVIDHHGNSEPFADLNLVVSSAAATAEVLTELFLAWQAAITSDIALCLLLAFYGDTGSFRYPNVTSRTLYLASELLKLVPSYSQVIDEIENNEDFDRVVFRSLVVLKAERFFNDKLIVSTIDAVEMEERGVAPEQAANSGAGNVLRSVAGCQVAITLVEERPGEIKFSGRGRDGYDVSQIAARFGGGGHKAAAGALIRGKTLEESKTEVKQAFSELYLKLDID